MKIKLFITAIFGSITILNAQGVWTQKANVGGHERELAIGFSIGSKGYIGTGFSVPPPMYYDDFWEYDPVNNTWTQKANVPGARRWAFAFAIGTKGYVGGGGFNSTSYHDLWEYNPSNNSWIQKANFPGGNYFAASTFVIGNNGYVCTGGSSPNKTLWEYNSLTDIWTQKADFAGGRRSGAVGFSIGNKGYVGTGVDSTGNLVKSFWEWDPSTNVWTQIADFGGTPRQVGVGFVIDNFGFVGTGLDLTNYFKKDFWRYNPSGNTWTQITDFGGMVRYAAVAFTINCFGYVGTGGKPDFNDFWQYLPDTCYLTEINQINPENLISVFPNPVTDKLNITINNNDLSEIILYDVASRKLVQQKFTKTVTLNTAQLAKGIYIYEVRNENGVVKKGKVIHR